ncbi:DNA-binding protein [Comamonas serinivorans]|uniref:DNA-binding protein n=1 Tax=Comamonas serinivorans TaxID=1082851 RepID=A0A1Y0ES73_9BURK|nr:Rrf2 family transcriptional regulator [Comamonas serinivorans]ARU06260.1 DNA-binding protein [Comamonas serinivorans]
MRLSTKGRFAVTAMIDVALREAQGPVALAAISTRHQISLSYLEQLFSKLRQQGLVESTRGPGGGYSLSREARSISVADIICAVDSAAPGAEDGSDEAGCWMTEDLWRQLNSRMMEHMQSINLRMLADEQLAKGVEIDVKKPKKRGVFAKPKGESRASGPNSVFALGQLATARG